MADLTQHIIDSKGLEVLTPDRIEMGHNSDFVTLAGPVKIKVVTRVHDVVADPETGGYTYPTISSTTEVFEIPEGESMTFSPYESAAENHYEDIFITNASSIPVLPLALAAGSLVVIFAIAKKGK